MYILGLTTLGDAAATLIRDGEIVAAAEEERFSRIKHHSGFPYEAIRYCLKEAGIAIADIAHVGLYWKPWVLRHKALQAFRSGLISRHMLRARLDRGVRQIGDSYLGMFAYPGLIRKHFGPGKFRFHFHGTSSLPCGKRVLRFRLPPRGHAETESIEEKVC